MILIKGPESEREREREKKIERERVGDAHAASFGDGRREHEARNAGSLWEIGKARKHFCLEPPEGTQLCRHLDFSPVSLLISITVKIPCVDLC